MRKNTLRFCLGLSLLLCPLSLSQCSSFYGSLVDNQVQNLAALNEVLSQVNNKESADAAAPLLQKCGGEISSAVAGIMKNGQPNLLELWRMKNQLESSQTTSTAQQLVIQYIRLMMADFYGSTELKNAFAQQISTMSAHLPKS